MPNEKIPLKSIKEFETYIGEIRRKATKEKDYDTQLSNFANSVVSLFWDQKLNLGDLHHETYYLHFKTQFLNEFNSVNNKCKRSSLFMSRRVYKDINALFLYIIKNDARTTLRALYETLQKQDIRLPLDGTTREHP